MPFGLISLACILAFIAVFGVSSKGTFYRTLAGHLTNMVFLVSYFGVIAFTFYNHGIWPGFASMVASSVAGRIGGGIASRGRLF